MAGRVGYFYNRTHVICLSIYESGAIYWVSEQVSPNNIAFDNIDVFLHIAYGQDGANSTEIWINKENNIKIIFTTTPAPPIKGTPCVLRFTVQNLETGDPVTNLARVAIFGGPSNQETIFLLTNISAPDGRFSVNVIFPNIGSYEIITRLMSHSHDVSSLTSFTGTVPAMQSSNVFGGNFIIWINLLIAIAVGVASFLVLKNTIKADKSQRT